MNEESVKKEVREFFDSLSKEEKNVLVAQHLGTVSRWDFKRILCVVLGVDNYMDDDALRTKLEKIIWER